LVGDVTLIFFANRAREMWARELLRHLSPMAALACRPRAGTVSLATTWM
jgi:hypothetical protein